MSDEATAFDDIVAWRERFVTLHTQRLSRVHEFGDADNPRIVAGELARITAQADAIADRMREDWRLWHRR